ncbi:apoptotic protease-activating factor 1-like [Oncorhynchus nerka]|uniref:apoptotic protease-activating factor 1-like n=1 Tax=Oncorhynchus nerka TaxID=8023 RepID=UPI0031B8AD4B
MSLFRATVKCLISIVKCNTKDTELALQAYKFTMNNKLSRITRQPAPICLVTVKRMLYLTLSRVRETPPHWSFQTGGSCFCYNSGRTLLISKIGGDYIYLHLQNYIILKGNYYKLEHLSSVDSELLCRANRYISHHLPIHHHSNPATPPVWSDQVWPVGMAMMEEGARSCLLQSRSSLEQDIRASYLMDHMISDGVLTGDEEDRIRSKPTRREQAAALLELLLRKDNQAYISFYNALVRESYGDLASLLHNSLPLVSPEAEKSFSDGGTRYVQAVLSEGGVPQRPVVFVSRPALMNRVREKLYRLQKEPGWVTVFGMAGSGKSVLAAEAVRDHALITECFPGGVHWLSIGQLDRSDLLVRIQSLCFRLEQQSQEKDPSSSLHRPPGSLEEAKERLRFLMLRRYPRSLLILDDIWDSSVLKAFDIQCRVLLTTRDRSLADCVSGPKSEVAVESGLEEGQALEILALYVNRKPQRLPEQARSIVRECKGSPLVVSLIGALLREFPDRWAYYLHTLQQKKFKRIRKSSSYDYDALDQAMAASIQVLSEEHRELYIDLTVLEKDVKVPAKVLSVLWDLEPEEVEDVLQDFVNKSLLFRDCHHRPYLYYLHDLQLDFLAEMNRSGLESLHTKVVRQYQQRYSKGPPTSGDEECLYWFRFLTYHMAKANLTQELYSLMFSLDWVRTKAQIMGPAHLINDYLEYSTILDKENSEVRGHFQEFLSLNGHQLEQRPFPDVVQLALSQPDSSEVYRQALLQAQERATRGELYLDWVNTSSLKSLSRLVVQPHQGSIYSACFSHDGTKIASCGSSKTLRVFKSTSGEKLLEIQAHDDEVLCCAFSPDDHLLATCSSDRKVKVWNVERGTLMRMFEDEHEEQVNHCQFTNTRRRLLLATCSNDKFMNTKLWNINKPSSQNTMFGHLEPVNHCCFSPDDAYLSTSSSDGTLKLWEVSSANEWKSIDVADMFPEQREQTEVMVKCSTWSAGGRTIICAARNAVFVFDVETAAMLLEIRTSRLSTVQYCHACPSSNLVAIALSHYAVELWDIETSKKMADCSGHLSWVHGVQFSPDGSLLLSCSDDQTVRVWETNKVHTSSAVCLKRDSDVLFNNGDITVVAADNRNRLQVRNGRTGAVMFQSENQESRIRCTAICSQTSAVGLGREDGTIQVLEVPSGTSLATLQGHTRAVLHCQFTPEGHTLITSSEDTTIRVWRWRTGECVVLEGHKEQVRCFSLLTTSPSSETHLLSWSFDGTIKVWDMSSGERLQDLVCHQGAVLACDVSPDGQLFATTSADKTAKVWSSASWECVRLLNGHQDCVRSCRFSWDGRRLATGDDNGEIRLWNVKDGTLLKICSRDNKDAMDSLHGGWVTDLHFSPDNTVLLSTGGYIKWWNVEKGEALQTFYPTGANLKRIHVSPDFSTFVTIDNIGILYILKKVE